MEHRVVVVNTNTPFSLPAPFSLSLGKCCLIIVLSIFMRERAQGWLSSRSLGRKSLASLWPSCLVAPAVCRAHGGMAVPCCWVCVCSWWRKCECWISVNDAIKRNYWRPNAKRWSFHLSKSSRFMGAREFYVNLFTKNGLHKISEL